MTVLRDRWRSLERPTRIVIVVSVAFVVLRLAVATQSGFGFHQGWNEGHYSLIARGFFDHPLVPEYGGEPVYNVPPLFPYLVAGSFALFGESAVAARLPSVIAAGATIPAAYWLGREVYGDRTVAAGGACLLAVLPYFQLYGGRAQTDALMTALFTAATASIVRGYRGGGFRWLGIGGVLFAAGTAAKQPTLLLAGVVLLWLTANRDTVAQPVRKTAVLIAASALALLPLFGWLALNYLVAPHAFVADWTHELFGRTEPFANLPLLALVGLLLGMTPPVLGLAGVGIVSDLLGIDTGQRRIEPKNVLVIWLALYGLFVLYRTPHGHQYYTLPLTVPFALLAARGLTVTARSAADRGISTRKASRLALVTVLLVSTLGGSGLLFELSGEYSAANGSGERVAPEAAAAIADDVDADDTVLVPIEYRPPMQWYLRETVQPSRVVSYELGELSEEYLRSVARNTSGDVYVVVARPVSPNPLPDAGPMYRTEPYRFTTTPAVEWVVDVRGEFEHYVSDRSMVVYRLSASRSGNETASRTHRAASDRTDGDSRRVR